MSYPDIGRRFYSQSASDPSLMFNQSLQSRLFCDKVSIGPRGSGKEDRTGYTTIWKGGCVQYGKEDTYNMERRIRTIWKGGYVQYGKEDTYNMERRIRTIWKGRYVQYGKED
eukprot:6212861-Pleurochrysis_carterae.AAC.3